MVKPGGPGADGRLPLPAAGVSDPRGLSKPVVQGRKKWGPGWEGTASHPAEGAGDLHSENMFLAFDSYLSLLHIPHTPFRGVLPDGHSPDLP